jgi:hypothetical protein
MTAAEWNECTNPVPMLALLRGRASDHRLRLFIGACCRRVWGALPPSEQQMYEALEVLGEGPASFGADGFTRPLTPDASWVAAGTAARAGDRAAESRFQADLVRCLFGGPTGVAKIAPAWRTGTVMALARHIQESREFGALPILADALQDAGCEAEVVLSHCRAAAVHVRGCFVVDGLLREPL